MNDKLKKELYRITEDAHLAVSADLHVHTVFSDGVSEAEETVKAAIKAGLSILGFSDHSRVPGESWCMTEEDESLYRARISELKEKYKDKIAIYCGVEQDALSGRADPFYDYVIGSAHAVPAGDTVVWADSTAEEVRTAVEKYYDGDYYAYAEAYYEGVGKVYDTTGCEIVGHFDLLTKFNEDGKMFDLSHPQYINAWKKAADRLCGKDLIFEVNTGGISRGYRTQPYPSLQIAQYLRSKGERLMLSSDSHHCSTLGFEFGKWADKYLL